MKDDWKVFANCRYDRSSGKWEMMKREILSIY